MVANFVAGGAAINALAGTVGARVVVVDAGVAGPIPEVAADPVRGGTLVSARIRAGTADMTEGPAMTRDEALAAIALGRRVVADLRADATGLDLLGIGEMGIGNTTAASALSAVFTGAPVAAVTGQGTGIDDAGRKRKIAVIETALAPPSTRPGRPDRRPGRGRWPRDRGPRRGHRRGGPDRYPGRPRWLHHGVRRARRGRPGTAPRTAAHRRSSLQRARAIGSSSSTSAWRPILELDLRLGEASGAALAMAVIVAAVAVRDEMATFDSAGVTGPA